MSNVIFILIAVLLVWYLPKTQATGPLVHTKTGKIRGHYLTSYKGNQYQAYQGIPFAQPPIGDKRFQSPVPIEPWSTELKATTLKPECLYDFPGSNIGLVVGSEDCLYLNVYVPIKRKTNDSLPVIYYIYGGAFRCDGPRDDQEQFIIDYDVIFVSASYRTGSLGFLSTEDHVVPGNMGLKDQSTSIRWIYDNIEYSGGDSKRITLVGGSSGAISLHHHYLSSWSRGLFHAGLSISGTAFVPGALIERSREMAIALGHAVNCTNDDIGQMVECMRGISADVLIAAQNKLQVWKQLPTLFGPVVEKAGSADPFLEYYPSQILKEGRAYDVPWITGIVAEEGLLSTAGWTENDTLKYIDENWDSLAPLILEYTDTIPQEQHANVARKTRNHYLGDKPIDRENFRAFTRMVGDRMFGVEAVNAAKAQAFANKSPVFFYYYNYRATDSVSDLSTNSKEDFGVDHGDDILLVISDFRMDPTKSLRDMHMQRSLIQIWTSVAYNGVPNVGIDWPSVTPKNTSSLDYLVITGPKNLKAGYSDNLAEQNFWNSIAFDEY